VNSPPVIPPVSEEDAFGIFANFVVGGITDFEGHIVEADFGDYTHIVHDEGRVGRVHWIERALREPDGVWRYSSSKSKKRRLGVKQQTYVKWICPEEGVDELFVVGTEIVSAGRIRLRTWYVAEDSDYELARLSRGE
jgi:hypothetical protein